MTRDGLGFFAVCCLYAAFWIAWAHVGVQYLNGVLA